MHSHTTCHLLISASWVLSPGPKCQKQYRICDVLVTSSQYGVSRLTTAVPGETLFLARQQRWARVVRCKYGGRTERTRLSHGLCSSRQMRLHCPQKQLRMRGRFSRGCVSLFYVTFSLCRLKAGAEPTLSWQPLTHIRSGPAVLTNEPLEVYDVSNRFPTEFAEKNRSFQ